MNEPIALASADTIAALATPPGRGGIAVVRVSGPRVNAIIPAMLNQSLLPRQATYLPFYGNEQEILDQGIALYFPAPHSFTGEDVLELHGHGGPMVVDLLLQRLLQLGARLARPGEFSERAFLHGKLDLTQAEAIADLINAASHQAARSAMHSLQGEFSKAIHVLNDKIIHLRMYVEASIDFTEEEIDFLSEKSVAQKLSDIIVDLSTLQSKAQQGSLLRDGITAVIVGKPNVGKSSLLNSLSGKEVAIVTEIAGTTRDVLRDVITIDGMPMHVIDTAGLRETVDIVEQEGIRRAYQEIAKADIVLYLIDATQPFTSDVIATLPADVTAQQVVVIRNKVDLTGGTPSLQQGEKYPVISISARYGSGLTLLKQHIKSIVGFHGESEGMFLARRRHLTALASAETHLHAAQQQLLTTKACELAAEELRLAHLALGEITGEFTSDDLLGRIFSSFCIGK